MRVAIIGLGGLGSALAAGLEARGVAVMCCDRHEEKLARFREKTTDPRVAVKEASVVVLAVKPKSTPELCEHIAADVDPAALVVSCAAGVPVAKLAAISGGRARAMPNIGASVGSSTTAIFLGPNCEPERDRNRLTTVFGAVGTVREVPDEVALHTVTAVAASGPAWLLLAVEALIDGAVDAGMSRDDGLAYAAGALRAASARLVGGVEPADLRAQVTSPNGTTAAGLKVLEPIVPAAFRAAVAAAVARSKELAG